MRIKVSVKGFCLLLSLLLFLYAGTKILEGFGIADNGDYIREMQGLTHSGFPQERRPEQVYHHYLFEKTGQRAGSVFSPVYFFRKLSEPLSDAFFVKNGGFYDMRALGILLLVLSFSVYLSALLRLQGNGPWIFLTVFGLILFDPETSLYFNSFYAESVSLLSLCALVGFFLLYLERGEYLAPSFLFAILLSVSKPQFALAFPLLLPFVLWREKKTKKVFLGIMFASFAYASLLAFFHQQPPRRTAKLSNNYQSFFYGVAMVAEDPAKILAAHNLRPESLARVGTRKVFADDKELVLYSQDEVDLLRNLTRWDVLVDYLKYPMGWKRLVSEFAKQFSETRVSYLGQAPEPESGPASGAVNPAFLGPRFSFSLLRDFLWSLFPAGLSLALYLLLPALLLPWLFLRGMNVSALVFLYIFGLSQIPIVLLGDGLAEVRKHLLVGRVCLDACLLLCLLFAAGMSSRHRCTASRDF